MTTEERRLCLDLVVEPPRGVSRISKEEFLQGFPRAVANGKVDVRLLEEACANESAEDLQCALIVGFSFGFGSEHLIVLCHLLDADWHFSHEDVVTALDKIRTPAALDALFRATEWIPEYLEYDDNRSFARKAIWALGNISSVDADLRLESLTHSDDANLRQAATEQILRRKSLRTR